MSFLLIFSMTQPNIHILSYIVRILSHKPNTKSKSVGLLEELPIHGLRPCTIDIHHTPDLGASISSSKHTITPLVSLVVPQTPLGSQITPQVH